MNTALMELITATVGTFGFSLMAHVPVRHLLPATLGGLISWGVYLGMETGTDSRFLNILVAALVLYAWCEVMARVMKAPVTLFLAPGVIPLLPGGHLYYTVQALLNQESEEFRIQGTATVIVTIGVACGIVVGSIIANYVIFVLAKWHRRKQMMSHET